jgi:hypothetical protein
MAVLFVCLFVCVDPFCGPERGEWVFDVCLEIEKDGGSLGCTEEIVLALEKSVECHKKNPYKHGFGKLRTNSG